LILFVRIKKKKVKKWKTWASNFDMKKFFRENSLSHLLSKNEKIKQHIRNKTHK